MASQTTDNPQSPLASESILTFDNVILRPYDITDAPAMAKLANDLDIAKNMRNTFPYPHNLSHAESFITNRASKTFPVDVPEDKDPTNPANTNPTTTDEKKKTDKDGDTAAPEPEPTPAPAPAPSRHVFLEYAIVRRADGALMGGMGLKPKADVEARTMEVGYWLGREFRRRGYMSEAVRGLGAWAFATFPHLQRLEAVVHEGNDGSAGVLRRAGYRAEGVRRKAVWKGGRALDLLLFGVLRSECPVVVPVASSSSTASDGVDGLP